MNLIRQSIEFFCQKKWLGLLLVLGLVLGVGISTFYRGAISPKQRTDLTVYLTAGKTIAEGRADHIYEVPNKRGWHYVYPPILAILLAPVSKWPLGATVPLAYLLSLVCLTGTILLSKRFPKDSRPAKTGLQGHASVPESLGCRPASWQITLSLIFCLPMLLNTFTRGQFGIISLFFMAAVFFSYLKQQKMLTGLLLALGIALKISPLAFLVFFFLMKREWKILVSTAFGFFLFLFLLPSFAIGFEVNLELLRTWKSLMSISQSDTAYQHYLWGELFTPFAEDNQSFYAVVTRFAWPSEALFVGNSNAPARLITSVLGILLLALPFVKSPGTSSAQTEDPLRSLAQFSLFPMLMLFTSPVTQIHHYTVTYFLFLAALLLMDRFPRGSLTRKWLGFSLWTCALSLTLGMIFPFAGYWGIPLWGSMLLWLAVLGSLHERPEISAR